MPHLSMPGVLMGMIVLIGLAVPVAARAEIEYRYNGGACTGKDLGAYANWYSVTTFSNGKATSVFGRGCDGRYYHYDICYTYTPSGPVSSDPFIHTGVCGTNTWNCRIVYDTNNAPMWIGGQDCSGEYYADASIKVVYGDEGETGSTLE